jgi:2-hydroxy-6-oxonona-2,4-dienedioate hydrolase
MKSIFKSDEARSGLVEWHRRLTAGLPVATESRTVNTTFGATHVLVGGPVDGPPLVMLHGALANSALLLRELAPLLDTFRVHAVDIVGQSAMSADRRLSVGREEYGRWIAQVMDGLELPQANVVGVSWGGFVGIRLAAAAPERISRLALLVPAGVVKSPVSSWFRMGWPMTRYLMNPGPDRLARFMDTLLTTPDESWSGYLGEAFLAFDLSMKVPVRATPEELRGFQAPTFVLGADADLSFPGAALLARARELFPNLVQAELLEGARHCPPTTDEFRSWLSGELRRFFLTDG